MPVVDPALIRGLDVGQAAYIYRGGVTYLQVKRLVAAPAAVTGSPRPASGQAAWQAAGHVPEQAAPEQAAPGGQRRDRTPGQHLPDASPLLDAAFGPEPAP